MVQALIVYGIFFLILTIQDRMSGPLAISYTEFDKQVEAGNVTEVFARGHTIQGALREPKPVPEPKEGEKAATYQRFSTERPVFAQDDLMQRLEKSKAVVRATPLVEERGMLANLLISFGPILLLVLFYVWMFRRQQAAVGGLLGGGKQRKPVDPETVRVTFEDVAGIDEVEDEMTELVDYLQSAREVPRGRRPSAQGRALERSARHGQDAARAGHRGRGRRAASSAPAPPSSSR